MELNLPTQPLAFVCLRRVKPGIAVSELPSTYHRSRLAAGRRQPSPLVLLLLHLGITAYASSSPVAGPPVPYTNLHSKVLIFLPSRVQSS